MANKWRRKLIKEQNSTAKRGGRIISLAEAKERLLKKEQEEKEALLKGKK